MFVTNEKGSILLTVTVVTLCLVLMGTALASLSLHDQKQTVRQQKNAEAMYIARGGAEAVAAYILDNPEAAEEIITKGEDEVTLENGLRFVVQVTEDAEGRLLIHSTGYSGVYSEQLTFSLEPSPELVTPEPNAFFPIFDMAIFADGDVTLGNSSLVDGNIGTHSVNVGGVDLNNSAKVDGFVKVGVGADPNAVVHQGNGAIITDGIGNLEDKRRYPLPIFPEFPDLPVMGDLKVNSTATISTDASYNEITVGNSNKLIFNVGSDTLKVRVKNFTAKTGTEITVNGAGNLILYIEEDFNLNNDTMFNVSGDPNKVLIYYKGSSNKLKLANSSIYSGCIYAETADFDLANSGEIRGSIFTGGTDVKLSNSSDAYVRVIYAPNALVTLHNSGYVKGAIVCNTFESKNSSVLEYSTEVEGIWDIIPDLEFEDDQLEPVEVMNYIKGSWSN